MSSAYRPPSLETPPWREGAASGPIALESHRPLPINDLDLVLHIVRGYVDLFAVRESASGEPGRRHLCFGSSKAQSFSACPLSAMETGMR
jgi:hypothetical protein